MNDIQYIENPAAELGFDLEVIHRWYTDNFAELVRDYGGKVIAMVDEQIVAVTKTEKEAHDLAIGKFSEQIPFVVTVPTEDELICLF